mmetsp:Transcript_1411/g.2175  ORF Transcript_1411/g.2175 Transcript_1411/m.2175 type:complete len:427 (-) Transcript_1411:98-1378(-)
MNIPPELKKITQYIRRAEELDNDKRRPESRIVAYYCREFAVLTGIPFASSSSDAKTCLSSILNQLEKEKPAISQFSRKEAEFLIRKFANDVFTKADNEDRTGVATRTTARTFYAAASFFEILQQFGESESQEEDKNKRVYCKWKATDILKAIKEGRNVVPGGYGELEETHKQLQFTTIAPPEDYTTSILAAAPESASSAIPEDEERNFSQVARASPTFSSSSMNGSKLSTASVADRNNTTTPTAASPRPSSLMESLSSICVGPTPDSPPSSASTMPSSSSAPPVTILSPPPFVPPTSSPSVPNDSSTNFFSGAINKIASKVNSINSTKKSTTQGISKDDIADSLEFTIFALKCLQDHDADLASVRLRAALECLGKSDVSCPSSSTNHTTHKEVEVHVQKAIKSLKSNDVPEAEKRLKQALEELSVK